jgi:hypothetical protein
MGNSRLAGYYAIIFTARQVTFWQFTPSASVAAAIKKGRFAGYLFWSGN